MSADNWAVCPRCAKTRTEAIAAMEQEVASRYGQIPVEEFDAMRAELAAMREERVPQQFREDYELGVLEDGEFYVIYKGRCRDCGLEHKFETSQVIA